MLSNSYIVSSEVIRDQEVDTKLLRYGRVERLDTKETRMNSIHPLLLWKQIEVN